MKRDRHDWHRQTHRQRQSHHPAKRSQRLKVAPGDLIAWEVGPDGKATVRRVQAIDLEYLHAVDGTLGEWAGAADEEAYRRL